MATRPWLDQYDAGVPHTLQPYPSGTLLDVVSETARQRPDHPALLFQGAQLSYSELERQSDALAAALVDRDIAKGDRVAILLPNCPQTVIAQLAVWKAGAIAAMVNPLYTASELEHMLETCGAKTAATLQDGWLLTGDLGYLDEEGYLYIVDRKKDLIKPSGFQVWPREVEEVIAAHPVVDQVGVAGVPDPYQGEAVKAWVVLREGQQLTVDELRSYCRQSLVAYKVPRQVEFRDSLPMSHLGKVLRRELTAQEAQDEGARWTDVKRPRT